MRLTCDGGRDDNSAPPELCARPQAATMGGVLHWTSVASFGILEDSVEIKDTRKVDQFGEHYLCLANDFLTNWGMCSRCTQSPQLTCFHQKTCGAGEHSNF